MANILILDDDRAIIEQMIQLIESFGHATVASLYPQNFYDILDNEKIDLLLLDIHMPEIDGLTILRQLKKDKRYIDLPIIILTGDTDEKLIMECFNIGAVDFIYKPVRQYEMLARLQSVLHLQEEILARKQKELELIKLTQQLQTANEVLNNLATTDHLTNIYNRAHFDMALEMEWRRCLREQKNLTIIMLDIDHFKLYNDTYGHQAGDNCLIRVADFIHNTCKRPADVVTRYGGEEFAIILPYTDLKGALYIAEEIRSGIEKLQMEHAASITSNVITVSLGICSVIPYHKGSGETILSKADEALYQAKNSGRNRVSVYTENKQ